MELFSTTNLVDSVIDEIALEGLDGITLEALWVRMAMRFHETTPLSRPFTEQIWNICLQVRELAFYELDKERGKLFIFDRYEYVDPDIGIILEPDNVPDDIYKHCPIDDWKNGIKGSCPSYYTRKDISNIVKSMNVHEAEKNYGTKLVIVASQTARQNALMDKCVCPILDMTVMQYCFLERVGRSRYHGEVTQGKLSLGLLGEDPRSLFYHRKFLLRYRLVTKQTHHQKSGRHSCSGSLLHLPRFYVERKPKIIFLAERVIDILKTRENQLAEYSEIKKELKIENSIKKLFKTSFFQKVVKTDLLVPWRTLYPQAEDAEWRCKNIPSKEKMLRVVQLLDPNIEISDLWKDEVIEEDDPIELDVSEQQYGVPILKQANKMVEASEHEGLGQTELAAKMGLPKLQSRTIFRNLAKSNVVATFMNDMGRQRVTKYVSRKFESGSRMSKQFKQEMTKMKKLTETPSSKDDGTKKENLVEEKVEIVTSQIEENKENEEERLLEDEEISTPVVTPVIVPNPPENRDSKTFDTATKILRKYKLTSYRKSYKRTFQNVADMEDVIIPAKRYKASKTRNENAKAQTDVKSNDSKAAIGLSPDELEKKILTGVTTISEKPSNGVFGLKDFGNVSNVSNMTNVSTVTYRLLKRANMIIESVKEHKVIDDMTKLIKAISEEEEREGYDVKIDKRSLIRLLQRLAKDNLVKNIKLTLSTNTKEKSLTFICDPSIDVNHTVIRSAVEQAKIKFSLVESQKVKTVLQSNTEKLELSSEPADNLEKIGKSTRRAKDKKKALPSCLVYDTKAGRRYGFAPKFIRMQALHSYLFYIIYAHPGQPRESQEKLIELLRTKGVSIDNNLEKEVSEIFNTEVGWKMFVPPLPLHNGWKTGWALMCDLLLRMPLSIFLKVHKVAYVIPELDEYTNHPVKKHLLVKDMPTPLRNVLFIHRKYIYSIHDVITRLCYVGLLQFGPQKFKEKDKVFVYLNRNTQLLDTTTSAAHYHKIEERMYPVIKYHFTSLQSIDKYWYKLWTICVNTRLGGRLVVQGKDIVLEELTKKNEMIEAAKPRRSHEASVLDVGHVPGDRMGAAGIDSAFFAHLKRNWNWESSNYPFQSVVEQFGRGGKTSLEVERETHMAKVKTKPVKFTEFHGLKKITGPVTVTATDLMKTTAKNSTGSNITNGSSGKKQKPNRVAPTKSGKQRSYVRRVLPRRGQHRARVKYDAIDYSALQRMDKLRVDWEKREDNILLVCKVAMMYLCPNPRRQMIGFTAVRDVLRSYSLTSHNKTSRACQRRLLYMLKKPETHHSVTLGVEELKQNFYINRRFGDIVDNLKREYRNTRKYDEEVTLVFRDLVAHIAKKHYDITDIQSMRLNFSPQTVEEFRLFHRVKYPTKSTSVQGFHDDTTNDIHSSTINSVIHSSMCCVKDRKSWAYQLFRIYQQYPEWLLRSAMAKIRTDQMVSIKKNYAFAIRKQSNGCMPMSSSQYQLSSGYVQKFNTKLPYSVFKESWDFFVKIARHYNDHVLTGETTMHTSANDDNGKSSGIEIAPVNGGIIAAIHDYINVDQLDFDLEIPRHIIMLDPTFGKDDERYIRIARRYQDILRNLEHFHMHDILDREDIIASVHTEITDGAATNKKTIRVKQFESDDDNEKSKSSKDLPKVKYWNKSESDLETTKIQSVGKFADSNEANVNTDTEAFESEHEMNFDDEDDEDCYDDNEDIDHEDDDLICFIDGTKIRLTSADIERSGMKVSVAELSSNDVVRSRENANPKEETPSKKIHENRTSSVEPDLTRKKRHEDSLEKSNLEKSNPETLIESVSKTSAQLTDVSDFLPVDVPAGDVRVNDLIDRANFLRDDRSSHYRTGDTNDVRKRYTRIALLKMREELNDLTPHDSHHAHEYFVLNMFKIFYSFRRARIERPLELAKIDEAHLPHELLPLDRDVCYDVMADLRKFAIFPKIPVSYEKFKQDLYKTDIFKRGLDAVYEYVREKRDVGASISQLVTKFYSILGDELYEILSVLKEGRLVLRAGVKNTRYIHQKHADPWLIHSYKIMRLQKEGYQNVPSGSLYIIEDKSKKTSELKERTEPMNTTEDNDKEGHRNVPSESLYIIEDNSKKLSELKETIEPMDTTEDNDDEEHQNVPSGNLYIIEDTSKKTNELKETIEPMDTTEDNDDEEHQNVPSGSLYIIEDTSKKTNELKETIEPMDTTEDNEDDEDSKKNVDVPQENSSCTACTNDSDPGQSSQRKMQKSRTCLLQTKDIYRAAKQLDLDTAEEIRVVVRPWIRIDGAVNRRVLDRMLGGVLAYCLVHPGVHLTKIQEKFAPAIQPFHTKELVEILMRLKCLKMGAARKTRVTLFSKSSSTRAVFSCVPERSEWSEEELVVEPMLGATLKFSMFLSTRLYTTDFLS